MPKKTKLLEFQVGDMVLCKTYGKDVILITEKKERCINSVYLKDRGSFFYTAYSFSAGCMYNIYTDINNKHYKILS